MRVILPRKPFHRIGFSTLWDGSTTAGAARPPSISAIGLFVLAAAATLTIFVRAPFASWGYALGIFLLGGYTAARQILAPRAFRLTVPGVALVVLTLWGFAQLATGATVYRYATWDASLRAMALAATHTVAASAMVRSEASQVA